MDIRLYSKESLRCRTNYSGDNFVDVRCCKLEMGTTVDFFTNGTNYIEIRQKEGHIRVFQFTKKSNKKEMDFGWWEDSEIVYSYNKNGKDK